MNKIQQVISTHKSLIILGGVLLSGICIAILGYATYEAGKQTFPNNHGIVTHSKTSSANLPATPKSRRTVIPMHSQHGDGVAYSTSFSAMPKAQMTSTSMPLHKISNATVHSFGNGAGNSAGNINYGNGQAQGIYSTARANKGAIYMPIAYNAITEVGATRANEMATTVTGTNPENIPTGTRRLPDHEEEWWLTPVGDIAWPLMILLAMGYIFFTIRGKRKARQ